MRNAECASGPASTSRSSSPFRTPHSALRTRRGFSLIEILVTVSLLSFIILGLLAMFNQVQRAFRSSITQTDVLEAGRAITDLMGRELEQLTPSQYPDIYSGNTLQFRTTNFFAELCPGFQGAPFRQNLPGMPANVFRTNVVQRVFLLTKVNQDWLSIGYQVFPDDLKRPDNLVGALYRFAPINVPRNAPYLNCNDFLYAGNVVSNLIAQGLPLNNVIVPTPIITPTGPTTIRVTNYVNRIADGVVHFRVRAFATNGFVLTPNPLNTFTNRFALTPYAYAPNQFAEARNTWISENFLFDPDQTACYFSSNAVPAYIELELGILEPQILRRYRALGDRTAQVQYLNDHAAQVHLFRQRIPIRNVDFSAYK